MIFASTGGAIYGEGDGRELPLPEDAERRPDAPYGLSKLCAELYLDLYGRLYGVDATSLRLGNVFGPRQDPHGEAGVVAIFCGAMLGDGTPKVFGDGEQTRDYIYVADVADGVPRRLRAARRAAPTTSAPGSRRASSSSAGRSPAACGTEFEPEFAPARVGEVQRIAIDPALAAGELGWSAAHDLERGIALTDRLVSLA